MASTSSSKTAAGEPATPRRPLTGVLRKAAMPSFRNQGITHRRDVIDGGLVPMPTGHCIPGLLTRLPNASKQCGLVHGERSFAFQQRAPVDYDRVDIAGGG